MTQSDADWLDEAARYFEKRPTGGEDMAFWANVANAERCRSIAAALRASSGVEMKGLEWENGEARSAIGDLYEVASLGGSVWQVRWNGTAFTGWHSSQSEARAAAQADYNQRIRSALASPSELREEDVLGEAEFLIERLDDFERGSLGDTIEDACRDFDWHVSPAIERLRAALSAVRGK